MRYRPESIIVWPEAGCPLWSRFVVGGESAFCWLGIIPTSWRLSSGDTWCMHKRRLLRLTGVPSSLLGVAPLHRPIRVSWEKPPASTVPVHCGNRQAPRVFPGGIVLSIHKKGDHQSQDPLLVPGVVHKPLKDVLGITYLGCVRDRHLWSLRPARGVHRSRQHDVVIAISLAQAVLVDQEGLPGDFQHLLRSSHPRVELALPELAQVDEVSTLYRYSAKVECLVMYPLIPGQRLCSRLPHMGDHGLERLQDCVLRKSHRLARMRSHIDLCIGL